MNRRPVLARGACAIPDMDGKSLYVRALRYLLGTCTRTPDQVRATLATAEVIA
jgi:hypothetical protein